VRLPVTQVETLLGSLSSLIDETKIAELPMAGRDVYTLLVLQPNVSSDNATARGLGFSVNGQQSSSSNFLLDGVDNNDLQVTGPAAKVSADAVKEYRMSTANFTAEFGRAAGTIANVITRSGANRFNGSLFEYFNDQRLNANSFANNWQGLEKERSRQHQLGGTLGGPIRREQLFFFGSFEQLRLSAEGPSQLVLLPSAQLVGLVPPGSIAARLLQEFPPPRGEPVPGVFYATSMDLRLPLPLVNSSFLGRLDYTTADGRQRLLGRYTYSRNVQDDFVASPYAGFSTPLVLDGHNLGLTYTRDLLGGTNELKFGLNRNAVRLIRAHPEIPSLASGDLIVLPGNPASFDYDFRDSVFHILDNYSRLLGRHSLIAGFEWRPDLHESLLSGGQGGQYGFLNVFDFVSDLPFSFQVTNNRQTGLPATAADFRRRYFHNEMAAFLQDNWKLTRRLTLNLGLRYEYFGAPGARNGTPDYNFVFGAGADIVERIANGSTQATERLFRPDRNNFAPRFGFALDLSGSGRSVLRGGYGIFFDRIFNNFWMDTRTNNLVLASYFNVTIPLQFQYRIPIQGAVTTPTTRAPERIIAVDSNLRTPYTQSWFVGWQHQLSSNFIVEINQTGAVGRKLATTDLINRIYTFPLTPNNPLGRINPREPDISFRSNQGASDHLALQLAINRRWSGGIQFQASYTLSRTRDFQSDPLGRSAEGEFADRLNRLASFALFQVVQPAFLRQFDPQADYGNSDFDQRHNLVFNFVAQIPQGVPGVFAGWQAAGLIGVRSGFPFSVTSRTPSTEGPRDPLGGFTSFVEPGRGILANNTNRADFAGKDAAEAFLSQRVPLQGGLLLLDRSKFSSPPTNRVGYSDRNAFHGPGFWNVDLSLSRRFLLPRLGERVSLQFRAEFFNLFNHTNLGNPLTRLEFTDPPFGKANFGRLGFASASPTASPLNEQPRRVQFALKLNF
ncbi:MAG TPA: TonB-dependent receptor, partial [Terriglobia bacterium]|nr:TonB-dependent receptor [Terriglobia bacterium]